MDKELCIDQQLQYIARISHGKDSLKMLDVIVTRGLPLDRITTTDVWATDTIRGEHPEMVKFKEMADEYIWRKYRMEVEHLCAMKNGEKVTYEKMFYHVPKRRPKKCHPQGTILGFPTKWGPWCQSALKKRVEPPRIQGFLAQIGSWCKKLKIDYIRTRSLRGGKHIVEYIGIAADEPARFGQLNERKRAPLVEFGVEEELCGGFMIGFLARQKSDLYAGG